MPKLPSSTGRTTEIHTILQFKKRVKQNQGPSSKLTSTIKCVSWNVRSINNKVNEVIDHITANGASIAFIQETWLKEMNNHTTSVIKAHGFLIHDFCRGNSGEGGVAVIFKPSIKLVRVFISHGDSFEAVSVKVVV